MFALIKEALSVYILSTRYRTLEQVCYGATGYSVEMAIKKKLDESQRVDVAVGYIQKFLPGMEKDEAITHLEAMHSRLLGVGENPSQKVQ